MPSLLFPKEVWENNLEFHPVKYLDSSCLFCIFLKNFEIFFICVYMYFSLSLFFFFYKEYICFCKDVFILPAFSSMTSTHHDILGRKYCFLLPLCCGGRRPGFCFLSAQAGPLPVAFLPSRPLSPTTSATCTHSSLNFQCASHFLWGALRPPYWVSPFGLPWGRCSFLSVAFSTFCGNH